MLSVIGYSKKSKPICPVKGTWKYSNSSLKNDFQSLYKLSALQTYTKEYLVFGENNEFKHSFLNDEGMVLKTLKGKWKFCADKIKISYTDVDFELLLDYFFIDKDLVLGQNFSHVIFTKDELEDQRFALK